MAQPPSYTPVHAFVSDSATLANFPGQQLDVEFNDVKATTDAINANLKLIQRDDGALANGAVTFDSLSGSIQSNGILPANAWATATVYQVGNAVVQSSTLYRALSVHTSGVFATDLAAGKWVLVSSLAYSAGTNISFAGSVISTITNPVFTAPTVTTLNGNTFTSGTYTLTGAAGKTFTFNNSLTLAGTDGKSLTFNNSLILTGTDGTTITFQASDTYVGRATTDTLTNKTFDTAGAGNVFKVNGVSITANSGTGNNVLATSPTITTPNIVGTSTNDSAAAGSVGEYIESIVVSGSALSLVSATAKTVTSISLTAGDWDVSASAAFNGSGGVSITFVEGSVSTTTNVVDATIGRNAQMTQATNVPGNSPSHQMSIGPVRFSLAGTTTVFLVVNSNFTIGSLAAYGIIHARRIR